MNPDWTMDRNTQYSNGNYINQFTIDERSSKGLHNGGYFTKKSESYTSFGNRPKQGGLGSAHLNSLARPKDRKSESITPMTTKPATSSSISK